MDGTLKHCKDMMVKVLVYHVVCHASVLAIAIFRPALGRHLQISFTGLAY